ncbi:MULTISPECIES: hypothetical protein [unclassified Oceanispirochaeta]|uniref:hypothetical protein n=1 Tax=unclassified Oceanispirochaeta TaxID=2635722 RepID=UPI000E092F20|nr:MULTISPECIES: hypothetical protein [unclassified Oceanispirochaeta]MBF9015871.1 hypothetical protein [Oceanispirochaeta sp. M2]NPD72334.1 hypothetical protein [Oceanispirochaeta sp. M1]RDG32105.1 hypothetical protein DV872_09500 [Oceanispirochaeta sp. M1]
MNESDVSEKQTIDMEDNERLVRGIAALGLASLFSGALSASLVYPPDPSESDKNDEEIITETE